jgi:hypothetical protein
VNDLWRERRGPSRQVRCPSPSPSAGPSPSEGEIGDSDATILDCGSIAPLVGRRARIVTARLDTYGPSWTDSAFPVLDPRGFLDLPRFGGRLRAWDQGIWSDGILLSCLVSFFCSAPGGAILSSRPARWCGRRAQRRSRTAPVGGRPKGLSLTDASTVAGWCASGLAA